MAIVPPPPHSPTRDTRARAAQETAAPNTPTSAPRERSRATSYSSAGYEYRNDNYNYIEESKDISIHAALATLIHSEKFSDTAIICGERQFKTHHAVVSTQSPFFDKAMSGDYKQPACGSQEMDMLSPVEGSDEWVTDDEPDEEYNDYDDRTGSPSGNSDVDEQSKLTKVTEAVGEGRCSREEGLKQLAELRNDMTLPLWLYVMADKYDVPALRLLARDRFYRAMELVWEEAECFPDVVDELYQTTPPTDTAMREIVCRLVAAVIHVPRVRDKMRSVMMKHGDFAVGVMEYSIHLHTPFV
ncbi:hypothetical protein FANTH_4953 [Fusarium anthophilum]|uniref:BTB domain-containing protein n=1 Tax=Fusarium anthophilum TaxID=48485 RepID=A0A8H4ZPH9_9HYPO|nr:hypothetical protein FANTH_4953 [Fusarium anthophilum]